MEGIEGVGNVLGHAKFTEKKVNYADTIFPCFPFIAGLTVKRSKKIAPIMSNQVDLSALCMMLSVIHG